MYLERPDWRMLRCMGAERRVAFEGWGGISNTSVQPLKATASSVVIGVGGALTAYSSRNCVWQQWSRYQGFVRQQAMSYVVGVRALRPQKEDLAES